MDVSLSIRCLLVQGTLWCLLCLVIAHPSGVQPVRRTSTDRTRSMMDPHHPQHVIDLYTSSFHHSGRLLSLPYVIDIPSGQPADPHAESVCSRLVSTLRQQQQCKYVVLEEWRSRFRRILASQLRAIGLEILFDHARVLQRAGFHEEALIVLEEVEEYVGKTDERRRTSIDDVNSLIPSFLNSRQKLSAGHPELSQVIRSRAYSLMFVGRYDEACNAFRSAFMQHVHTDRIIDTPLQHPSETQIVRLPYLLLDRIKHDIEQLNLLMKQNRLNEAVLKPIIDVYDTLFQEVQAGDLYVALQLHYYVKLQHGRDNSSVLFAKLNDMQLKTIAPYFNHRIYLADGSRLADDHVLNSSVSWLTVQQEYVLKSPRLVVVDGFLSQDALTRLRDYFQLSTIWNVDRIFGYIGTYVDWGMEFPLLFQLVEELVSAMPEVFCQLKLSRAWAYKMDTNNPVGLNKHADAGAVTVNFWLTDDTANLNITNGGLIVYEAAAPVHGDFSTYTKGDERFQNLLGDKHKHFVIPYRSNRMVLFRSDLLHETDTMDFRPGYLNRRISVTLLFGLVGQRCNGNYTPALKLS